MKILVVGRDDHFAECTLKLAAHDHIHVASHSDVHKKLSDAEVVFDFLTSEEPESFGLYQPSKATIFLNTWKISLGELVHRAKGAVPGRVFGFNGFPTMFNREFLEVTALKTNDASSLRDTCEKLGTPCKLVDDRVGFVTPRVVCMIINEAYYVVQEGTASREDIDLAMRLGTNYPCGPFEWCEKIGLKYVYELLDAVYQDTRDERYKISALMKKEYLSRAARPG